MLLSTERYQVSTRFLVYHDLRHDNHELICFSLSIFPRHVFALREKQLVAIFKNPTECTCINLRIEEYRREKDK